MNDSILESIKKLFPLADGDTSFDHDFVVFINSAFNNLHLLGIGPTTPFTITGSNETWSEFMVDKYQLEMVKEYVYIKVKLVYDPPANSFTVSNLQDRAKELEWKFTVYYDEMRRS